MFDAYKIKTRNWCFTAYKKEEADCICKLPITKYGIYGIETCPTTRRIHYQGYVEFNNTYSLATIRSKLKDTLHIDPEIHLEKRFGSRSSAIEYCKKDGVYIEFGSSVPDRSTFDHTMTVSEIAERWPHKAKSLIEAKRTIEAYEIWEQFVSSLGNLSQRTYCLYIFGKAGAGKTRTAWNLALKEYGPKLSEKVAQFKFNDGFFQCDNPTAECLICNEFRDSSVDCVSFLEFTDPYYPSILNIKGGRVYIWPKFIILCSVKQLKNLYSKVEEDRNQFIRRFKVLDLDFFKQPFNETLSSLFGLPIIDPIDGIETTIVGTSDLSGCAISDSSIISDSIVSD